MAYAVLHGLTSAAGGMVAAATTSLPERADTGRDYDYRYAWIRDQCYAGIAVAAHGPTLFSNGRCASCPSDS
ncbi:glycoside hydrolase family 15 protein [Streptomyces sp. Je 1-369]|uniref:glycoside hydrolase family 15 protein n=1 Tax=Streptomyces sp. Je 1-369 TaxID=2966192 RepID=UPI00228685B7|nr:glycoside hydrolase family 15 protein [Streptomyces sp. Je 1-369]WAL98379.1 glycoside hydrolase family 15 protein [Streptomyces sp. Je 1-369]